MRGWILYKYAESELPDTAYETRRFLEVAHEQDIEIQVVKPEEFELIVTRDDRKSILLKGKVTPLPDFVLPRMGAGTTYFALAIIRHLERLGVTVINSAQSTDTVKDKLFTHQILAASNVPVPRTMLAKFPVDLDLVEKQIGFPVVVKTVSGSLGLGVYLSESRSNFEELMSLIESTKPNANIILQEFIATSRGRDLRVIVIGGRAIACMKRQSTTGSFKSNIARGGSATRYEMTPEIEMLAIEAARVLNLDIAGIDLLFGHDDFKVCEVNSAPMFAGMESCHPDLNVAGEIFRYVRMRTGRLFEKPVPTSVEPVLTEPTAS
ncbi:MAG: RimK family alpha-L-glutamate ligase [Anaerolineae bacterium]